MSGRVPRGEARPLGGFLAHLWVNVENDRWAVLPLAGGAVSLTVSPPRLVDSSAQAQTAGAAILLPPSAKPQEDWVLLTGSGAEVRVNGLLLALGLRVLADRDEIRVTGAGTVFFSTERLARIAAFPSEGSEKFCPRCKLPLEAGSPAVRCPNCAVWYHQHEQQQRECWTYAEACALCSWPSDLDAGYSWTPEDL